MDIVSGSFNLLYMLTVWPLFFRIFYKFPAYDNAATFNFVQSFMGIFMIVGAVIAITASTLAIIGGIYAMRRKRWRLALAGAIGALFGLLSPLGIAAIIFTALSRKEFE